SHPALAGVLARGHDRYAAKLAAFATLFDPVAAIPAHASGEADQPQWINGWIPGLDGLALYAFTALRRPGIYLEVGSGSSTRFVRRAIRDGGLATRIVSIDPEPRAEVNAICDDVIRRPLEDTDLAVFERLAPGDVVFVDDSHRCFQNSDATVILTEVLPRLPAGVLIGLHDIFLPDDYPPEWNHRLYSEQYLLAAFLLGGHRGYEVALPAWYASQDPSLAGVVAPLFGRPGLEEVERHGSAFWLESVE
ncbi:MAG: class I SAM-dependent methyltransferase, partial [Acidimicrobiia bacterium]